MVLLEEGSVALHLGSIFVNGVKRRKLELRSPPERRGPSEVRLLFKGEEHLDVAFQDRAEADGFFCACRALREKGALALPRGPATPLAAQRPAKRARLDVEAAHALALRGLRRESAQLEILRQNMEGRLAAGEAEGEALRQRAERLEQARKAADAARRASEAAPPRARGVGRLRQGRRAGRGRGGGRREMPQPSRHGHVQGRCAPESLTCISRQLCLSRPRSEIIGKTIALRSMRRKGVNAEVHIVRILFTTRERFGRGILRHLLLRKVVRQCTLLRVLLGSNPILYSKAKRWGGEDAAVKVAEFEAECEEEAGGGDLKRLGH